MATDTFTIHMNGRWTLPVDHIWPDGDAPEDPTAQDVAQIIEGTCIDASDLVSEWNLRPDVSVDGVRVNL